MLRHLIGLLAATVMAAAALAQQFSVGDLVVSHPWSRPTAAGMPIGVAYLSITNKGEQADTLIAARTPAAARVELHRTSMEAGMMRMRPAGDVVVAAKSTVVAEPGGLHLMLIELKQPLVDGSSVPLILTFRSAGEITVQLKVEAQAADAEHAHAPVGATEGD